MRSGSVAKKMRFGPMRKLERGPYSRAVLRKKSRGPARSWRMFPPMIVPLGRRQPRLN
jgi:hypothetical protein